MEELKIYLDTWIIQDGNYKYFRKGQVAKFALEFYNHTLKKSSSKVKKCTPLERCMYEVNAEVAYIHSETSQHELVSYKNGKRVARKQDVEEGVVVLDIGGIMVYGESRGKVKYKQGSFVKGKIAIGIDPFFYKEYLCKRPGIPELRYDWRITKIEKDTTPFIITEREGGGKVYTPDMAKVSYKEVEKSDAWDDMPPFGGYVLTIEKV